MSFSRVQIVGSQANPDYVYYNATIVNNSVSTTSLTDDPPITFQDTRLGPVVKDSSQYDLAVMNFSLNGASKTLPVFIPQIQATTSSVQTRAATAANIAITVPTQSTYSGVAPTNSTVVYKQPSQIVSAGFYVSVSCPTAPQYNTTNALVTAANATTFTVITPTSVTGTATTSSAAFTYTYIDPTKVNNTVYSVTFAAFNGTANGKYLNSTQYIQWEPENQTSYTVVPTSAYPVQSQGDYYYCYTYNHWVRLINKALYTAWNDVTSSAGYAASSAGTAIACPFVEFDETTGLFSISQDAQTSICPVGSSLTSPFKISTVTTTSSLPTGAYSLVGMNSNLEGLISNWENIYYGANKTFAGATAGNSYTNVNLSSTGAATLGTATGIICPLPEVVISNGMYGFDTVASATAMTYQPVGVGIKTKPVVSSYAITNPFTAVATSGSTLVVMVRQTESNISSGSLWSPCCSFVIATNSIPVRMEANANPVILGQGNVGLDNGVAGSFQKVLIETPINAVTADLWRGWILYEPLVPSYTSLDPVHDGITQLDFQVYWRNRLTNLLTPLRLPNTGTMSIRLQFRRKGVN
jgi:hypothetical protein